MLTAIQRHPGTSSATQQLAAALIVGAAVFAASLLGILSRPIGFLAAVWPANAVLLGLMVRNPAFATVVGWLAAFAAFFAADFVTGSDLRTNIWLTVSNMAGAMAGYAAFRLLSEDDRRLRRSVSVLYLFAACCVAALASALASSAGANLLFGRSFFGGLAFWFVSELVNNLIVLPILLTYPGIEVLRRQWKTLTNAKTAALLHAGPALALLASVGIGMVVGGPGSLAFPIPALLWCALTYSLFTTTVLTMALSTWLLIALPAQLIPLSRLPDSIRLLDSIRLGVALLALGPLTVASTNAARKELIDRLYKAANFDSLTGALSRGAFLERAESSIVQLSRDSREVALLMIDVDHFKRINDRFGHAGGDKVLTEFYHLVASVLREADLFGRTGGEEFAVLLPQADLAEATGMAERIRLAVEGADIAMASGDRMRMTVSIGIAVRAARTDDFEDLLLVADRALYQAKSAGRNMVRVGANDSKGAA
ncbi:MAG: hypothetical protein ABS58_16810 [Mesorhizobium sp. SCN 65-20]|nr:MAG: hypothetical protein ABS58_16810 [Mesorhizobium sp. SCN 65-20]